MDDILYIEGLKDYLIIHLSEKKVITRLPMKIIEDMLYNRRFIRISKSYIVNMDKIDSFDKKDITIGNNELSIGLIYRDRVLKILLKQSPG